ncbi:unnamed protein product [Protopolystoma xenopodis]|uniref:Cystatin domain-containing protein n=1 Tax=Protopolystoma xenopodis TaxID=117903 RepID=A0A3S5FBY4_9PLAT|nr:unnamed protein product [Protopolystoma xenopodis]
MGQHVGPFESCEVVQIATQVVSGINYFVKVKVGENCHHVRIYETLPHAGNLMSIHSVQKDKHHDDRLILVV